MLIEVDSTSFIKSFPVSPHPFLSAPFIEHNKEKVEEIYWLVDYEKKPEIGLMAGLRNGVLYSHFSAPFGGFHFNNGIIYISVIDNFISSLKDYLKSKKIKSFEITLPPDIYHLTFNAKVTNSLIRKGFKLQLSEITNWVNLSKFNKEFKQKNCREYYRQALRNNLSFGLVTDNNDKENIYNIICENRKRFGRTIFMSFSDILGIEKIWPVDYFKITTSNDAILAGAIFYRSNPNICYAVFWGDNEVGRPLRAMDFMVFNLWNHYKRMGFEFIDLGISTESGIPNEGLLRFKESHEAVSSLRHKFIWSD